MAIYFFEDITAAQALSYTPSDVLVFTTPGLTASQVSVSFIPFTAPIYAKRSYSTWQR